MKMWAPHAIDFRLRLSLGCHLGPAVTHGVHALGGGTPLPGVPRPETRAVLHTAGQELLATVDAHLAGSQVLPEEDLGRLCFVAAFYKDIFRTGEVRRFSMLADATPTTSLDELTASVPVYAVDDIGRQMELAEGLFERFRAYPPPARLCGPMFAGSQDLGGADADFILGGLLLDCKATTRPRRLGTEEIYQLAGYLLLDYDDRFGINQVGSYLSRQGALVTWHVQEFLQRLGASYPLSVLRARLRAHLRHARAQHPSNRTEHSVPLPPTKSINATTQVGWRGP
ncbi:hypothetical protein [Streptomyces sp. 8K308]|uniref:hypothetical protein n=1 Tax=Streptomyces sp. 8K308 TaxID=2530388 RepID=UPI001A9E98C4|nr:hypothetical protein [Streptomyces sp. 8K308]